MGGSIVYYWSIAGIEGSQFVNVNQLGAARDPPISRRFCPKSFY